MGHSSGGVGNIGKETERRDTQIGRRRVEEGGKDDVGEMYEQ